ncbi:MAG: hypothetical protein RLN89_00965 [Parvibaculum sp.]
MKKAMKTATYFDETSGRDGVRPAYRSVLSWIESLGPDALKNKRKEAEALFRKVGITFAVYGEEGGAERLIPFDIVPRVFTAKEWR